MAYTVRDSAGVVVAGDDVLDDVMKAAALLIGGSVVDESDGSTVYEAPRVKSPEELNAETLDGLEVEEGDDAAAE